jgi:spore coat protein CotF
MLSCLAKPTDIVIEITETLSITDFLVLLKECVNKYQVKWVLPLP